MFKGGLRSSNYKRSKIWKKVLWFCFSWFGLVWGFSSLPATAIEQLLWMRRTIWVCFQLAIIDPWKKRCGIVRKSASQERSETSPSQPRLVEWAHLGMWTWWFISAWSKAISHTYRISRPWMPQSRVYIDGKNGFPKGIIVQKGRDRLWRNGKKRR